MAVKVGDTVVTRGCVMDSDGSDEHAALVVKVHAQNDIDCVIFVLGADGGVNMFGEKRLRSALSNPTGKRFLERI